MSPSEDFTAEQERVIALSADARALVDAPAGTGKTHVLAGRLTRLVEHDDLSAGDEILVLSFSRAAVSELRARVSRLGGDARYVGAATFDAFATRLLATEDPDGEWMGGGYEERILAAVNLLRGPDTPQLLAMVRHVLVDEIQDLVGPRASLVSALLDRVDGGFTLFGDPAQAIYGHQLPSGSDGLTNADLYAWLAERFDGQLSRLSLTLDFRGRTDQAEAIADIGLRLRCPHPDHREIASELRTVVLRLPTTTLVAARRVLLRTTDGTSAVLCRTNAQALRLSRDLFDLGIPHRYQRRGEDKAAAAWLGATVFGHDGIATTRSELMPRLRQIAGEEHADELFAIIRKLDPARGDGVDLRRIADRLRDGSFPEELNEFVNAPVVVSTIHRAKGLEFERVLLCDPGEGDASADGEENRILYVGLSRARREIFHLPQPDTRGLVSDRTTRRLTRRGFGANSWRVFELEIVGADTESARPAGTALFEADPVALQQYLGDHIAPGDPVELVLAPSTRDDKDARFLVQHRDRAVGVTTEGFGTVLCRVLRSSRNPPRSISGLHVEMIDTVAGDAVLGRRHGLGAHGMWRRVRVFGMGVLTFDGSPVGEA